MKKILGYIPLEAGEDHFAVAKETDVIKIEQQWFKLTEVWIPGVAMGSDLYNRMHFRPKEGEEKYSGNRCANCGETKGQHKGPNGQCKAKGERILPGTKFD